MENSQGEKGILKTVNLKHKKTDHFQNLRVLAVDDEEIMGYLIQRVVKSWGFKVDWVTNCEAALRKIDEVQYDVILSDFKMPQMSGEKFYHEIAKKKHILINRLVFITGDTINTKTIKFFKSINVPYLTKPFEIQKLKETISDIVFKKQLDPYAEPR
jgi:CheY-like chemotaxis protein